MLMSSSHPDREYTVYILLKLVWKLDTFMDDVSNGYALLTALAILVGCCAAAEFINRFCPWILGKSRQKAIK